LPRCRGTKSRWTRVDAVITRDRAWHLGCTIRPEWKLNLLFFTTHSCDPSAMSFASM